MRPARREVVATAQPPGCTLDARTQRTLCRLATTTSAKYVRRGDWVAIVEFDVMWDTAFVAFAGVPSELVCRLSDAVNYIRALHAQLVREYADRGLGLPEWRGWRALARRWPWLATAAGGGLRVRVVRPIY